MTSIVKVLGTRADATNKITHTTQNMYLKGDDLVYVFQFKEITAKHLFTHHA